MTIDDIQGEIIEKLLNNNILQDQISMIKFKSIYATLFMPLGSLLLQVPLYFKAFEYYSCRFYTKTDRTAKSALNAMKSVTEDQLRGTNIKVQFSWWTIQQLFYF